MFAVTLWFQKLLSGQGSTSYFSLGSPHCKLRELISTFTTYKYFLWFLQYSIFYGHLPLFMNVFIKRLPNRSEVLEHACFFFLPFVVENAAIQVQWITLIGTKVSSKGKAGGHQKLKNHGNFMKTFFQGLRDRLTLWSVLQRHTYMKAALEQTITLLHHLIRTILYCTVYYHQNDEE